MKSDDERGTFAREEDGPQDTRVDRRAFLERMGALGAVAAAGVGWPAASGSATTTPPAMLPAVSVLPDVAIPGRGPELLRAAATRFWEEAAREARARGVAGLSPEELTAWEAGVRLRDGSLRVSDLVGASIERIRRFDGVYRAFNTVVDEAAFAMARALDGRSLPDPDDPGSLLYGIPLAMKDNVWTAGVRTTANAHMFHDFVPERDAELMVRLRGAGAVLVGKTQMGPLATTRALTPDGEITTVNAWAPDDPRVSPGGSSSGSATAVAARLATTSVGTQTGGSITVPAESQGLTGLKPTMGRVSLRGVIPLTYTRDHPGPIARDARDAALVLQAIAGPDAGDPRTLGLPPVPDYLTAATPLAGPDGARIRWPTRLGVPPGWMESGTSAGRRKADFLRAMEAGGVTVVELEPPPRWNELSSGFLNAGRLPERSEPFLKWLREDVRLFGVTLSSWIQGLLLSGDEYLKAQRARLALLRLTLDAIFHRCDVMVLRSHLPFDMIGLPLLTMPIGFRDDGERGGGGVGAASGRALPEGILLGASPFGEERLLALAALWQARSEHHRIRPRDPTPAERSSSDAPRGRMGVEEVAELSE